ncbi:MAG: metallophosphoesterase [Planctomycetota bacterium]|nr:metallophosphoesterase [Planctomycetota bacterium]MDA1114281.1 metallophosphoesterase [Planctomycetota bacterium]
MLGLSLGGFLGLGWFSFGLRLPPLQWEPADRPTQLESATQNFFVEAQGAYFVRQDKDTMVFRAFVPEPTLVVTAKEELRAKIIVQNLSPKLLAGPIAASSILGLTRQYDIPVTPGKGFLIMPRFPSDKESFRFAAIGDTGGEAELQAAVDRAKSFDVDFLLHLGDIEYKEGGLERAALILNQAIVPTFAAIGNHDFHDGLRLVHRDFAELIGPRNSEFVFGGVQFLNLDTAADTYPAGAGSRGALLARLTEKADEESKTRELVVFTHRPLDDPRPGKAEDGHALGSKTERDWLASSFATLDVDLLLHGHIHQSIQFEVEGITAYIVGNGLQLKEVDSSQEQASLLIGEWSTLFPGITCRWETLQ